MDALRDDLRQAARVLRQAPGVSTLAILTLAVGIGAAAAVYSAVAALLLRPLPVPDIDRVGFGVALREGFDPFGTSVLDYEALRHLPELSAVGVASPRFANLVGDGEPERVHAAAVSASYFETLQIQPAAGRRFTSADDSPSGGSVAIVSHTLARRRFAGRTDVVGQTLTTDEGVMTVVGVMPPGFDQPARTELWVPARLDVAAMPLDRRAAHTLQLVARLRGAATLETINARVRTVADALARDYPQFLRGWTYELVPLRRELLGDIDGRGERGLTMLAAMVGLLLAICCANVGALLLVRSIARRGEMTVRLALGAGRLRLLRLVTTESVVLALLAGVLGLLLASWMVPALAALQPIQAAALGEFLTDFRIDWRVVAFSFTVSLASAVVFGAAPAAAALRPTDDVALALRRRSLRQTIDRSSRRTLGAIVIAEVAIAASLLIIGGLSVQSFQRLMRIDLGFRPDGLLTTEIAPGAAYSTMPERIALAERLLAAARAIPGVVAAGFTTNLPLDDPSFDAQFTVEGQPPATPGNVPITANRLVTPGYMETLGVRLLRGRFIDEHDRAGALPVVVVTEQFAREAWPGGEDPIGRRVRRGGPQQRQFPWLTVVGLIADTKEDEFNFRANRPAWYLPYAQSDTGVPIKLAVRGEAALSGTLRAALRAADRGQPFSAIMPLTSSVENVMRRDRFSAVLFLALASIGLVFAVSGLYAVIAYSVSQRRAELGLRVALGASRSGIIRLVMREGGLLIAAGLAAGLAGARTLALAFAPTLYGIQPGDTVTFATTTIVLAVAGFLACYVPARRAGSLDPARTLRME
jgi:putative ABC transport system permease protein